LGLQYVFGFGQVMHVAVPHAGGVQGVQLPPEQVLLQDTVVAEYLHN
jgi:hypothetical protein